MTLFDFWQCTKHYFYIVVAIPVLFAIMAFFATSNTLTLNTNLYTAVVDIYSNTGSSLLYGLTEAQANSVTLKDPSIVIDVDSESQAAKISVAVSAPQEEKSIEIANEIAEKSVAETKAMFSNDELNLYENYTGLPFEAMISDVWVTHKSGIDKKSILGLGVGFAGGIVIAVIFIVLIYAIKRPVISKEEIEEYFQLPVLAILGKKDEAERLLANVRFSTKRRVIEDVCIVPVSGKSDSQKVVAYLEEAAEEESMSIETVKLSSSVAFDIKDRKEDGSIIVYIGSPLNDSMAAAYVSQSTDATLIVAKLWDDSMKALKDVIEELLLADAKLAGCVLVKK